MNLKNEEDRFIRALDTFGEFMLILVAILFTAILTKLIIYMFWG